MGRRDRTRRRARAIVVWAMLEIALGVVGLLVKADRRSPHAESPPPTATRAAATSPSTTVVVTGTSAPPASAAAPAVPAGPAAGAASDAGPTNPGAAEPAAEPATVPPPSSSGTVAAPAIAVACHPDLSLEASPDAPFNFLCLRGTTPVSWATDSIRLFTTGLTPAQTAALPVALAQWERDARFTVSLVSAPAQANVVMTGVALTNNEDGYTSMHYICTSTCVYDHADVRLAADAELTKTSWVATILHELGHVAGLNHVARHSEVMYPQIDGESPASYGSGDLAGFQALEAVRTPA